MVCGGFYRGAIAATAPAPTDAALDVTTISTGYFHLMNFAHPIPKGQLPESQDEQLCIPSQDTSNIGNDPPQYAHFLPTYLPRYGMTTILSSSSSCCRDSLHSRSASE